MPHKWALSLLSNWARRGKGAWGLKRKKILLDFGGKMVYLLDDMIFSAPHKAER